jgi:hypothetical protein
MKPDNPGRGSRRTRALADYEAPPTAFCLLGVHGAPPVQLQQQMSPSYFELPLLKIAGSTIEQNVYQIGPEAVERY